MHVSQSAPNGVKPWAEKEGRGRLIGRTKGGMSNKLHAVTNENGRTIHFFMCACEIRDYTGAAALLSSLPSAQWLLAVRGYDTNWFCEGVENREVKPCIPGPKSRTKPVKYDKRHNRIETMLGRLKDWRRVATLYNRSRD